MLNPRLCVGVKRDFLWFSGFLQLKSPPLTLGPWWVLLVLPIGWRAGRWTCSTFTESSGVAGVLDEWVSEGYASFRSISPSSSLLIIALEGCVGPPSWNFLPWQIRWGHSGLLWVSALHLSFPPGRSGRQRCLLIDWSPLLHPLPATL